MARNSNRDDNKHRGNDDGGSFRYHRRSAEDTRKRASERSGNFDSFIKPDYKRYKPRDGKNLIRILPPPNPGECEAWPKPDSYAYRIFVNYGIGADNQSFLSLSEMRGEKDPLAEAKKEAQHEGDKEMAKKLTPRKRATMWLIDRLDEGEGPQIWDAPWSVDTDFVHLAIDEDTKEIIYFDDPDEGCDIRFYKEGAGLTTKYPAARMKVLDPSPLSSDKGQQEEWLEFIRENPIPDCLQFYDYDHIAAAFDGVVASNDDDGNEKGAKQAKEERDERPQRSSSRQADDADKPEDEQQPRRSGRQRLEDQDDADNDGPYDNKGGDGDEEGDSSEVSHNKSNARPSIRERLQKRRAEARNDD